MFLFLRNNFIANIFFAFLIIVIYWFTVRFLREDLCKYLLEPIINLGIENGSLSKYSYGNPALLRISVSNSQVIFTLKSLFGSKFIIALFFLVAWNKWNGVMLLLKIQILGFILSVLITLLGIYCSDIFFHFVDLIVVYIIPILSLAIVPFFIFPNKFNSANE